MFKKLLSRQPAIMATLNDNDASPYIDAVFQSNWDWTGFWDGMVVRITPFN